MNSPAEIAKIYSTIGSGKTKLPFWKLLVLSIFAGAFIAFGAFGSTIASCQVEPAALGRFLSAAVFPIGLMMVLCAGAELFTGNCLIYLSVLDKKAKIKGLLYNLIVVYIGNAIGGIFFAWLITYSNSIGLYDGALAQMAVKTAVNKVHLPFGEAFLKGILCNVMVCIAVWIAFGAAELTDKILGSYLPVFLFVICGFEHCVANMYFIPVGIFSSMKFAISAPGLNWATFAINNLIPVTLGNIVGGSIFVAAGYWFIYLKPSKKSK